MTDGDRITVTRIAGGSVTLKVGSDERIVTASDGSSYWATRDGDGRTTSWVKKKDIVFVKRIDPSKVQVLGRVLAGKQIDESGWFTLESQTAAMLKLKRAQTTLTVKRAEWETGWFATSEDA